MRFPGAILVLPLAFSTAAFAVDLPTLKAGSWEVTRVGSGPDAKNHKTTMCLDDSVQAQMRDFGMGMAKDMCSKNDYKVEGNKVISDATCKMGNTTMTTKSVMTYNNTTYHTEILATYDPPMANNMKESKTVLEGKWAGPCKTGQQPGDMTLENGQTINMKTMMQQQQQKK